MYVIFFCGQGKTYLLNREWTSTGRKIQFHFYLT